MDVRAICRLLDRIDEAHGQLERTSAQVMSNVMLMRDELPYLQELINKDLQSKMRNATRER